MVSILKETALPFGENVYFNPEVTNTPAEPSMPVQRHPLKTTYPSHRTLSTRQQLNALVLLVT